MNYQGIFDRIATNLGEELFNDKQQNIAKRDVYDVIIKILRKTEAIKNTYSVDIYDGTTPANSLAYSILSGGAELILAGTYKFKISYTTTQGETLLSDELSVVIVANCDGFALTGIPVKPNGVTAVNIYRTLKNGSAYYRVVSITNDSIIYSDTTLDAALVLLTPAPTVSTANDPLSMPSDFFFAYEVVVTSLSNNRMLNKELTEEELLRWNPDITFPTTSFSEIVVSATPQEVIYTQENYDFDGYVGYSFIDRATMQLQFKPAFNGHAEILYASIPTTEITTLTVSPAVHHAFQEIIVTACTIRGLRRKILEAKSEVQMVVMQNLIADYKKEYEEALGDYAGFVDTDVSTPVVFGFDFLSDPSMLLLSSY